VPEYLLELYLPAGDQGQLADTARRARAAAASLNRQGTPIRYLRSILVPEDETCFCLYQAASADQVQQAAVQADLPVQRISEAISDPKPARR
jgi:Nickel responsive protein SCO4226-like